MEPFPTEPFPIDTGWARFVCDRHAPDHLALEVNGVPSSELSLSDPLELEYEYMRWMFAAVDATFPRDARLRAMHLGAGACALPRALAAAWPASRHLAVEIDAALAAAVRAYVPLPRAPRLRLRVAEARAALAAKQPGALEVIVRDAFAQDATPPHLATREMAHLVARALAPGGIYLANCGDGPGLERARREVVTLAPVLGQVAVIAEPGQFRGRRRGNVVLLAGQELPDTAKGLARKLRSDGFPARIMSGQEALTWARGARPFLDEL
jgi:hypothetical protein